MLFKRDFVGSTANTSIPRREPLQFLERQRISSLFTLDFIGLLGSTYNLYLAATHGFIHTLVLQVAFLFFLGTGNLLWFLTRRLQAALIPVYAALVTMIASTVIDAGGLTGFGLFFLLPVFPIMYIIVGLRGGTALILLGGTGMVIRLVLGHFLPSSIYNVPGVTFRMMILVAYTTLVVFLVNFRIDALIVRLSRLVLIDWETGLPGRWKFEDYLRSRLSHKPESGLQNGFSVVGFRILNFNRINAMEGPTRCEMALREVGKRVRSWQEHVEITSRWHSALFISLLDTNDFLDIDSACRSLLSTLSRPILIEDRPISLLCSIAISRFPDDADDVENLIGHVVSTLDRNSTLPDELIFFDRKKHEAERHRYRLFESLVKGDFTEGFSIQYQPKIRFADGSCGGAEVLMRWTHPLFGPISPAEFIAFAEEIGSIRKLTRTMILEVFRDLQSAEYAAAIGPAKPVIAINLSGSDLMDQDLLPFLSREFRKTKLDPSLIEFEITEGTLIDENPWVRINIDNILTLGFRLAIDDFGTGYSSLSNLQRLKVHDLKIDQSFVRALSDEGGAVESPMIDAIVSMGKALGLEITAEGVETEVQARFLASRGVDLAQGWLYSKSLPFSGFLEFMRVHKEPLQ